MTTADLMFGTETVPHAQEESQLQVTWRRFRKHRLALVGIVTIIALLLFAFVGPTFSPYDENEIPTGTLRECRQLPPNSTCATGYHPLGTDKTGRDYMTRLMVAGQVSLGLAIFVTLATQVLGTVIGGISGYTGGWLDSVTMRTVDFMLTLPLLPLLIVLYVLVPPAAVPGGSIMVLSIILIAFGWLGTSRLVRGMVLSLRNQEFAEAARALGASDMRIIGRHMVPNSLAPVIVAATLGVGSVVVLEAALSFLGFGVKPPDPSWGNMLRDTQGDIMTEPFKVFWPGMCIFLTSLSFNFVGDALRDALDPRLKK